LHPTCRSVSVRVFVLGLSLGLAFGATATPVPAGYEGLPSVDPDGTPLFRPDGTSNASLLPWEDYAAHIQKRSGITALGPNVFGDSVSLYTGALSFSVSAARCEGSVRRRS
jgi:hypothetical protein